MNPWDKNPKSEPARTVPATPATQSPTATPAAANGPGLCDAETLRSVAEAVKLGAEANESRSRQLRQLEEIATWLQRGLAAEAARLRHWDEDLRKERTDAGQAEAHARQQAARFQLWPAVLQGEPWRPWRERLLERAAAEGPAALLLARLHTAAALDRAARPMPLELVRDIGRSVYETCAEDAERLAQALTQAAAGRFEVRTVRPGDRLDNKFMKASAGGLAEVRAVAGWAVRDNNGIWQFPAEVS